MKLFLLLSTAAMVSAGIYGLADMSRDLRNGTMIEYDRGDHAPEPEPPAPEVKKQAAVATAGKAIQKQSMAKAVSVSSFFMDFTENYSRSMPVTATIWETEPSLLTIDTVRFMEPPAVAAAPAPAATILDSVAKKQPEENVDFTELYSRRPLRPKKPLNQEALKPSDDSLKAVSGKDDL